MRADVADELDVERLFTETIEAFGGIDAVVHAVARRTSVARVTEVDLEDFDALWRFTTRPLLNVNRVQRVGEPSSVPMTTPSGGIASRSPVLAAPLRPELARAHLLYGEWLRRGDRGPDCRHELRAAYKLFTTMGAEAFAERARRELVATGVGIRPRHVDTGDALTAQEEHIARLARDGRSNSDIAAELFISTRTVEWHLRKVFTKLDITSRKGLTDALRVRTRREGA